MIIKENINGAIHTYSDAGFYIYGGWPEGNYTEAFDPFDREYVETDILIETSEPEESEDEEFAKAGRIMMGVIQ